MKQKIQKKELLPLIGITCATFLLNTSEFIPIGLLTDISKDFGITESHAGLVISIYALVVMLLSLPLMLLASRIEYKRLLIGTLVVFTVFQFCSAMSHSFAFLVLSRAGVACSHAIFWAIVTPLAVKVVSEKFHSLAISMVATGTSIAMIAGMPIGRMIGLSFGWRMSFFSMGVTMILVIAYLLLVFPRLENDSKFSIGDFSALFKRRALVSLYIFTVLTVTSYYLSYSYIEPFLIKIAGFSETAVTDVLMLYGFAGLIGSFLYARFFQKMPIQFIGITVICMTVVLFLLLPAASSPVLIIALCAFWGIVVTAFNVSYQGETIHCAPEGAATIAMAIASSLYNFGISLGSEIGGQVTAHLSVADIGVVSGCLGIAAALYCCLRFLKLLKPLFQETAV